MRRALAGQRLPGVILPPRADRTGDDPPRSGRPIPGRNSSELEAPNVGSHLRRLRGHLDYPELTATLFGISSLGREPWLDSDGEGAQSGRWMGETATSIRRPFAGGASGTRPWD